MTNEVTYNDMKVQKANFLKNIFGETLNFKKLFEKLLIKVFG